MEKMKRSIRLFFVSYGRLLFYLLGVIFITIFIIQSLNSYVKEQNGNKYSSEEILKREEEQKIIIEEKQYISQFIEYCNEGKIGQAYEMLSDSCKQQKYINIDEFQKEYINAVFNINICDYEIIYKDNIYMVTLVEDMLITGKTNSTKEQKFKIEGDILEDKIYICE